VLWRELLRLLEEEIAAVQAAFEEEMKMQEEKDAIARDACLAPAGETWEMLLRQEAALDRSIDRKLRIILTMCKEHAKLLEETASPPGESAAEADGGETSKSPEQSENVVENNEPAAEGVRA